MRERDRKEDERGKSSSEREKTAKMVMKKREQMNAR